MTSGRPGVRAVVDTNLVVSGLLVRQGIPARIVDAIRSATFTLVLAPYLREENARVLSRPKFAAYGLTPERVAAFLFLVDQNAQVVAPRRRLPVAVRDAKDTPILATALGGKADYLVSGDDDLLVLRDHPAIAPLQIVTAREFVALL